MVYLGYCTKVQILNSFICHYKALWGPDVSSTFRFQVQTRSCEWNAFCGTRTIITLHAKIRQLAQLKDRTSVYWAKAVFCGVGAKNIEKKMFFIIHLVEILSYLSTRCSSEPKSGY